MSQPTNFIKEVNDMTLVTQEYFQLRVKLWLQTIGRYVFGIKHHWLRYEFAPGRGQIHAHMLAITNHMHVHSHYHYLGQGSDEDVRRKKQAQFMASWVESTFHMTSSVHPQLLLEVSRNTSTKNKCHPSSVSYLDVVDSKKDEAHCLWTLQRHSCSEKCLQSRKYRYVQQI